MREIKFRAWDTEINKMVYPVTFSVIDNNLRPLKLNTDGNSSYKFFPLMQYTGLKDKNGKEIFEGDEINVDGYISQEGNRHYVEFYKGAFGSNVYSDFELLSKYKNIEIIGNIYENPELINN